MNRLTIIGNLTRDPETRSTQSGKNVCTFTVAVNRRRSANGNQPDADFFRVSAWDGLGETCQKYLAKGRKVAVTGSVSVNAYTTQNGENRASMEVFAQEVEFLSSANENTQKPVSKPQSGYVEVDDDLPWA